MPSIFFFCLFLKIVYRFQITDPLNNLAEVEQGFPPPFLFFFLFEIFIEEPSWPPFAQVREVSYQQPPNQQHGSALRTPAVCLPNGLPAWRRVKRLSWT